MSERRYDPDLVPLLPLLPVLTDFSTVESVERARAEHSSLIPDMPDREDVEKHDRTAPGPEGAGSVGVRIYRRKGATAEPQPCVFEIHGGGFMTGSIDMMDAWCQDVTAEVGAVVVSVEYRLAPENPFPAGVEDSFAALCWTAENAAELGIDPQRIAVAGQSAGGGLAAAVALLARDRAGPHLCFQLLEIPELDDRLETASMREFTDTPIWNRPNAVCSWRNYLGANHQGEVSPYAAPARAQDLSGLPPAYISTMEYDPLRDEGILYALRLLEAGVPVELHSYPGTFHGSAMMVEAAVSKRNRTEVFDALLRALRA